MIAKNILNQLIQQLGKENVVFTEEDLLVLGYDATPGLFHLPDVVVYPTSTEAVQAAMQIAREEKMPITPRGSGSGLSGGSIPAEGGMVICLNRMNKILEIDEENLTVTAEAGTITLVRRRDNNCKVR